MLPQGMLHIRFSAAAVINGAVLFHHSSSMESLVFDNPHARVLPLVTRQATFALSTILRNRRSWALRFRQAM